ncbi:MAG TPA: SDR family NAD(P)-dependent oxidoreductase [Stellaceae bacterium]|nr:SDR family NAD(P)-dependent oxidoreductase [Stellaceae bacterium]
MSLNGRRVLITGAGGFIGSHLAEELTRQGARTRALVRYNSTGRQGWLDDSPLKSNMEIVAGDVTDHDLLKGAMRDVEIVFHLAALIAIPYSYEAPESYVQTNVLGTLRVLQAARDAGVVRVIQTSTSEVYGTAQRVPIGEDHPLQGQSPYSASKIGADKIAESFHLAYGLPVVTLRPFNTFGPRQSARAVIPTIVTQCLEGDRVRLGALTPTRDLTYVADTAEGFLAAAVAEKAVGETINLGTGQEIAIGDLATLIGRLMGKTVRIESEKERLRPEASEVGRLKSDNGKARTLLGWRPKTTLEDGLRHTIEWLKENRHRLRTGGYVL